MYLYELLFFAAHDTQRAVKYLQLAAENVLKRSAPVEATHHLTRGLELLKTLPDTRERAQQELILQITLGAVLMATRGQAAQEVEKVYARAQDLCQQVGDTQQLFSILRGLRWFHSGRGEHQKAREFGERCLSLAQRMQDPALLLEAHYTVGVPLFYLGELSCAHEHLEQALALYEPTQHHAQALHGWDSGVASLSYVALTLWLLGYPEQALRRSQEALSLPHDIPYPHSQAFAFFFAAVLHHLRGETQAARERAEAAVILANEQGFAFLLASGSIVKGWALVEQGQEGEGVAMIHQSLAATRVTDAELARTYYLASLVTAYGKIE